MTGTEGTVIIATLIGLIEFGYIRTMKNESDDLAVDKWQATTMALTFGIVIFASTMLGASWHWWVASVMVVLFGAWVFFTDRPYAVPAVIAIIAVGISGAFLIFQASNEALNTRGLVIHGLCVAAGIALAIAGDRYHKVTVKEGDAKKLHPLQFLQAACYVAVLIAAVVFVVTKLS